MAIGDNPDNTLSYYTRKTHISIPRAIQIVKILKEKNLVRVRVKDGRSNNLSLTFKGIKTYTNLHYPYMVFNHEK